MNCLVPRESRALASRAALALASFGCGELAAGEQIAVSTALAQGEKDDGVRIASAKVSGIPSNSACDVRLIISPEGKEIAFDVRELAVSSVPGETVYAGCIFDLTVAAPPGRRFALATVEGGGELALPADGWALVDVRSGFAGMLQFDQRSQEFRGPRDAHFTLDGDFSGRPTFSRCAETRSIQLAVVLGVAADVSTARVALDTLGSLRFALQPCTP